MREHPVVDGRPLQLGDRIRLKHPADGHFLGDDCEAECPRLEGMVTTIRIRCPGNHDLEDRTAYNEASGRFEVVGQREMEQVWVHIDNKGGIWELPRIEAFLGDGDPSVPGGIGCEHDDTLWATAESAMAHVLARHPSESLKEARDDLRAYVLGLEAAGVPSKVGHSLLELADQMVRSAT